MEDIFYWDYNYGIEIILINSLINILTDLQVAFELEVFQKPGYSLSDFIQRATQFGKSYFGTA